MSGLGRGRSHADIATLEIARAYKDNPLLAEFPIPRMTIDEIVIDLKVAVADVSEEAAETKTTKDARDKIAQGFERTLSELPKETAIVALSRKYPNFKKTLAASVDTMAKSLRESIYSDENKKINASMFSKMAAATVRAELSAAIASPDISSDIKTTNAFLSKDAPELEKRMMRRLEAIIIREAAPIASGSSDTKERTITVLATAAELETVSPEKITTIKLTLKEADRAWAQTEDGEQKQKLVPF